MVESGQNQGIFPRNNAFFHPFLHAILGFMGGKSIKKILNSHTAPTKVPKKSTILSTSFVMLPECLIYGLFW
jgi:hypothetical protein